MTSNPTVDIVKRFLRLMEERELDAAGRHVAAGVTITFPGGRTFASLDEQVRSSAGRFRSVTKTFEGFDHVESYVSDPADPSASVDQSVVYVFGTLGGVDLHGTTFDGIRFIDRFVVRDGLIVDQRVWNDLAESGVLSATANPDDPEPN